MIVIDPSLKLEIGMPCRFVLEVKPLFERDLSRPEIVTLASEQPIKAIEIMYKMKNRKIVLTPLPFGGCGVQLDLLLK